VSAKQPPIALFFTNSERGWSGQEHLADGGWRMQVHREDAVDCNTGAKASGTTRFTINVTLNGLLTNRPQLGFSLTAAGAQ
jgi:hypothetical protein